MESARREDGCWISHFGNLSGARRRANGNSRMNQKKGPRVYGGPWMVKRRGWTLQRFHIGRGRAFLAVDNLEADAFTFL